MTKNNNVTVEALVPLRDAKNKITPVGGTVEVLDSVASVLVKNKQAKIIKG